MKVDCRGCKCFDDFGCVCMTECPRAPKIKTNFDRIKAMSVAEMVDFIERIELGDIDYSITFCDLCQGDTDCTDCIKKWLEAEYKESGDL